MIGPSSRYAPAATFTPAAGVPPGLIRPRPIASLPGVIEHTLSGGDRLDLLARHYYNDPRRWWRIVDANPEVVCGADIEAPGQLGNVIQIPAAS
jgi:nucleoid-associated protein YgaU